MQRWNISEAGCRWGANLLSPPGPWEQLPVANHCGLAALLLQAAIISWLVIEHRRRHLAEAEANSRRRKLFA